MSKTIRHLVHAAFIYTCVEGLVINVTYPNVIAYVVKDGLIMMMYFALVTEHLPSVGSLRKLVGPILAFVLLTMFFLLMPTGVSLLSALVAVKQRLFYIPLMYIGYYYTRTEQDAFGLVRLLAWTCIPTSLFGIYLFFAGPLALQALGGTYSAVFYSTTGLSGIAFWRVPGTFTSPGQYALYLLLQSVLLTGFLFVPTISRREKVVAAVALTLAVGAMLASGTRMPLVIYVLCVGLTLFYLGRLTRLGTAALAAYAVLAVFFTYFGAGVQDRVGSVLTQENLERFQSTAFGQVFYSRMMSEPLGLGLGMATIGGRHFTEHANLIFVESYLGVIATETGIFGLIIWLWVMAKTVLVLVGNRLAVKRAAWSPLWFVMTLLLLEIIALMPSGIMIDSSPGNMYFWFLLGVVVRLGDVQRARLSAPAPAAVQYQAPSALYAFQRADPRRL